MAKIILYPSKIDTAKERSTKTNIQKLSEKNNLKSANKSLAYWGVKKPTPKGNPIRSYPDSLTSISGSFYKPAPFTASGFKISGADKRGIVNKISVQYKWEQISYSSTTAYGSFKNPVIDLKKGSTKLDSITGSVPEKIRYDNCSKDSCKNTDSAELATLHNKAFSFNKKITVGDLADNISIVFTPAKNTANTHLRIVMQFFRIVVEYTPYKPKKGEKQQIVAEGTTVFDEVKTPDFTISTSINKTQALVNEEYDYTITVQNIEPEGDILEDLPVTIDLPSNTDVNVVDMIGIGDINISRTSQWLIKSFEDNYAKLVLRCKTRTSNNYAIFTASFKYPPTQQYNKADSRIKIISDAINFRFYSTLSQSVYELNTAPDCNFILTFGSEIIPKSDAVITIETDNFINYESSTGHYGDGYWLKDSNDYTLTKVDDKGTWKITNIRTNNIKLSSSRVDIGQRGTGSFKLKATYTQGNKKIEHVIDFTLIGRLLEKEYFKLRLEDGSDVQYNSLTFMTGDDLETPLTYEIEDTSKEDFQENMTIIGETKRFSTKEARYASFDIYIESDEDKTYNNIITYIDAYDEEDLCEEIIVGSDENVDLIWGDDKIYCIIRELKTNTHNEIKFILESNYPREAVIKIKPLNYDEYDTGKWRPMHIHFKDIPNIQMKIKGPSELIYNNDTEATFKLYYTIQNNSDVKGEELKFQLTEPAAFLRDVEPYRFSADTSMYNTPTFDKKKRIIYFPELEANSEVYTLEITYRAQKRGIFEFAIQTIDYTNTINDDQYYNIYRHKILTNVTADLDIKTSVSNSTPYLNDIIDYTIEVTNRAKRQEDLTFTITEIGHYDVLHPKNDYNIIEWDGNGVFEEVRNKNNIGVWTLNDVAEDEVNKLVLSLQPKNTGVHVIKTSVIDKNGNAQNFEDYVQIYEPDKKLSLNVYHAVNLTDNENCCDPNMLTEICDDDFINVGDDIYYVFEVTNNEKNRLKDKYVEGHITRGPNIKVRARLPNSFKYTDCHTKGFLPTVDNSGLITFHIDKIEACTTERFCIKVTPQEKGNFVSNFVLSARNTKTTSKKLNLTVDSYINERKTEHEITIYNFEKTNRYFRYELDGSSNLFKFYNKGDISKRTVDIEKHNASKIETYRGSTLKELVDNIKENSKYVEPELIRIGSNHLATKGYELYPNGFINRFGLLNSEVYHYTGQLPTIGNLVDYALRWDIDEWDMKVWSGDIYQNGVFDLTVNYGKIPTNFNILELSNPLGNLQALVDRVKPFGTRALCYFSFDVKFELRLAIDLYKSEVLADELFELKLNNMGVISWYNRFDNSVFVHYDFIEYYLTLKDRIKALSTYDDKSLDDLYLQVSNQSETDDGHIIDEPIMEYCVDIFTENKPRKYIKDCYDIVENLQAKNNYVKNITISKKDKKGQSSTPINIRGETSVGRIYEDDIYDFYFDYDINYEEEVGVYLETEEGKLYCKCSRDRLTSEKFTLIHPNGEIIKTINKENINNFKIQVQSVELDNSRNVIHFWCAVNQHDYEYLGYYVLRSSYSPMLFVFNQSFNEVSYKRECEYTYTSENDEPIVFSIDDNKKYDTPKYGEYYQAKSKYQWDNLKQLGKQVVTIQTEKDTECADKDLRPPKLMLRYDKFNIDNTDEIEDIYFDIKTNKYPENLKIGVFKDGTSYLPKKNIAQKTYIPYYVDNVLQEYNSTISIQQPNITICSNCLQTSLGYHDTCPHCSSNLVTHQREKNDVTVCYNCGWIEDGWQNRCVHCLSKDIVRTVVDYNKTYCYNCQSMHDDYYNACPYCFSTNIIHLQNDSDMYRIYNQNITDIDPIIIKSDIQGKINLCNITIPLNRNSKKLDELESLTLVMNVSNYNNGEYYYCENCETAGLGNPGYCPYCNSNLTTEYHPINLYDKDGNQEFNLTITTNATINGKVKICEPKSVNVDGTIDIEIPILDLIRENYRDNFTISIDAENVIYDKKRNEIIKQVSNYGQGYVDELLKSTFMDMSINNFYFKSEFVYENKWNIGRIEGSKRTGIQYITDEDETNYLAFHFNVDLKDVDKLYFHINGVNKSLSYTKMNIKIFNKGEIEVVKVFAKSNFFEIEEDIYRRFMNLDDVHVEVNFYDVKPNSEIIITDCYLVAEQNNYSVIVPQLNSDNEIVIDNYADKRYLISSENMWGINETTPKYLIGQMLNTGLLACFEFDNLDFGDILKIYDIKMIIKYKNKLGSIVTGALPITDNELAIQMVNADVVKRNGENWGAFKVGVIGLNNLESDIINTYGEQFLDSIPVLNTVSQSFYPDTKDIYKIIFYYEGKIGYPNDYITMSIYDDFNNEPDTCLASQKVILPKTASYIQVSFQATRLNQEGKYWIVLEDKSANEFNYHKFGHNANKETGNLYIEKNGVKKIYDHMALAFTIENGNEIREFIEHPHTCELDTDIHNDFKLYESLYRIDAQTSSNVFLSNLLIQSGFRRCDNDDVETRDLDELEDEMISIEEIIQETETPPSLTPYPECDDDLECVGYSQDQN